MKKKMTWLLIGFAIAMATTAISQAQGDLSAEAARAKEMLLQARQAIGGEARLNEINSISAVGVVGNPDDAQAPKGKIKLRFVLSDKGIESGSAVVEGESDHIFIKRVPMGEGETWNDENDKVIVSGSNESAPNAPKKRIMIKRIGPMDGAQAGQLKAFGPGGPPYLLGWFLKSILPVDFVYAGDAENGSADALDIKAPNGGEVVGRLLLDKVSRLPIGINYRGIEPQMMFVRVDKSKADKSKTEKPEADMSAPMTEDFDIVVAGPEGAPLPAPQPADIQLRFSDHRMVNGVMLPYHITKSINGKVVQDTVIESYEVK